MPRVIIIAGEFSEEAIRELLKGGEHHEGEAENHADHAENRAETIAAAHDLIKAIQNGRIETPPETPPLETPPLETRIPRLPTKFKPPRPGSMLEAVLNSLKQEPKTTKRVVEELAPKFPRRESVYMSLRNAQQSGRLEKIGKLWRLKE